MSAMSPVLGLNGHDADVGMLPPLTEVGSRAAEFAVTHNASRSMW
jgi:hypothetical protein